MLTRVMMEINEHVELVAGYLSNSQVIHAVLTVAVSGKHERSSVQNNEDAKFPRSAIFSRRRETIAAH